MSALADQVTWESLLEKYAIAPLAKDEKTPAMFAQEAGISMGWACAILKRQVAAGTMTRRPYFNHGWAYRPKGKA